MQKIFRSGILIILVFSTLSLHAQPQIENIDRGIVAVKNSGTGVFISWRLLAGDPSDISFNIYKGTNKLNAEPLEQSTNYIDNAGTLTDTYYLVPVIAGIEQAASATVQPWSQNYLSIPLIPPAGGTSPDAVDYTYNANDCSTADLDGDGSYDIVLKWDPSNSKDNSQSGYTGNVFLDAYKLNGTRLWRIDLGINIRAGAHYTQFMVFDLDGDGKAEIACKTAPGTKDASGNYLSSGPAASAAHTADYRNSSGYILSGPEYFTVFDGQTGLEIATADYDPPRGDLASWGDTYGNRVDRFLACIAYLDGSKPSVVMCRGYYTGSGRGRTVLAAWDYRENNLSKRWTFSADYTGAYSTYTGQGNHNLSVGDVDDDGRDEIIYGSCAIDDDGTGLWTTGLGHGDALHLSDIDPDRPGLEVWGIHEGTGTPGSALLDAKTGEIIWKTANADVGRGVAADLISNSRGMELWGGTDGLRTPANLWAGTSPSSSNHVIWWDGDLTRELLNNTGIDKYSSVNLLTAAGCSSNNGTKSNPALQADILGDWREEVIFRTTENDALRIYTTTTETPYRITTLMHDHIYRMGIAWQNVAYNQPPHTGYYLTSQLFLDPPEGFIARNDIRKIMLFWKKDGTGTFNGYNIYRSNISGTGFTKLNTSLITDTCYLNTPLTNSADWFYKLAGVDKTGAESELTSEITSAAGPVTYLQENEGAIYGGSVDSNNSGFNGTGFFNFGTTNSHIDFNNIGGYMGGPYILKYRYALGSAGRTGILTVNGISQDLTMKSTSVWTSWVYDSIQIFLKPGFSNNIRFAVKTSDFGNLDEITVRPVTITGIDERSLSSHAALTGIYPNPLKNSAIISYQTVVTGKIRIDILDIMGRIVAKLEDLTREPGEYELIWDGRNASGEKLPRGIYYCRLVIDDQIADTKKIVIARN